MLKAVSSSENLSKTLDFAPAPNHGLTSRMRLAPSSFSLSPRQQLL